MTKHVIEVRGKDVENAVTNGLSQLGLSRSDVEIEVLDEGSRGLLGIGSRDAVVKLSYEVVEEPVVDSSTTDTVTADASATAVAPTTADVEETAVADAAVVDTPAMTEAPPVEVDEPLPVSDEAEADATSDSETSDEAVTAVAAADDDDAAAYAAAREKEAAYATTFLQTLLGKMQVEATVTYELSEPDDITGRQINVMIIEGNDLGTLIGPRGDTLNSLQYISRLAVGHHLHQRANFVIDIEGYRQRRRQALSRLAERMAQKAIRQGRTIGLEPMPPHERRIIHMALRDNEIVYTESVGEGRRRKVRIIPK